MCERTNCKRACWACVLALAGCEAELPVAEPAAPVAPLAVQVEPAAETPAAAPAATAGQASAPAAEAPASSAEAAAEPSAEAEYEPPFPPRENLFAPPDRGAQPVVARSPEDGQTHARVALKGFVRVDAPRAVLLIGEEITALAVGEEHAGVTLLSIEPPQVTLQRGRTRWSETLASE